MHAHNESYSSNDDERVLYKTRRLYVRSNTKSTISSPANPNQSFSNSSIKDKSILYAIVFKTGSKHHKITTKKVFRQPFCFPFIYNFFQLFNSNSNLHNCNPTFFKTIAFITYKLHTTSRLITRSFKHKTLQQLKRVNTLL